MESKDAASNLEAERLRTPPVKRQPGSLRRIAAAAYSRTTQYLGFWKAAYSIHSLFRSKPLLAVFTFHRVINDNLANNFIASYDRGVTRTEFESQILGIKKRFAIIPLETFADVVAGKKKLDINSALLTFDDADSEFISEALPILKKHQCPATVFVPTEFVEGRKHFWHLRVSNALLNLDDVKWQKLLELSSVFPQGRQTWLNNLDYRKRDDLVSACWRINLILDRMAASDRDTWLSRLEETTGSDYKLGIATMSWEHLRQLQDFDISIESHAASHRKLAELSRDDLKLELQGSKQTLESQLNSSVTAICYPAGSSNDDVAKCAIAAGYSLGFTTNFGFVDYPVSGTKSLMLPRFDMRGTNKYDVSRFVGELLFRSPRKEWPLA